MNKNQKQAPLQPALEPVTPINFCLKYNPPSLGVHYKFKNNDKAAYMHEIRVFLTDRVTSDDVVASLFANESHYLNPKLVSHDQIKRLVDKLISGYKTLQKKEQKEPLKLGLNLDALKNEPQKSGVQNKDIFSSQQKAPQAQPTVNTSQEDEKKGKRNFLQRRGLDPLLTEEVDDHKLDPKQAQPALGQNKPESGSKQVPTIPNHPVNSQKEGNTHAKHGDMFNFEHEPKDKKQQNLLPNTPQEYAKDFGKKGHKEEREELMLGEDVDFEEEDLDLDDDFFNDVGKDKKGRPGSAGKANIGFGGKPQGKSQGKQTHEEEEDNVMHMQRNFAKNKLPGLEQMQQHAPQHANQNEQSLELDDNEGIQFEDGDNVYVGGANRQGTDEEGNLEDGFVEGDAEGEGEGEGEGESEIYEMGGMRLRKIQIEGSDEDYLMDSKGNVFDMEGNFIGQANGGDDEEEEGGDNEGMDF